MLKIDKKEPLFFADFIKNKKLWSDIKNRAILNQELLKEQINMCAYCESRLKDYYHIDHFYKRDLFPKLTFDYDNLFLSCNCENSCAKHKDSYGLKIDEFNKIFSPKNINLDEFEYSFTGEIIGKTQKANKTIEVFNLNSRSLVEKRKKISINSQNMMDYDLFEIFQEFKMFLEFLQSNYIKI